MQDAPSPDAANAIDAIDAIARDLDDVDAALKRLDAGTYFTDEVTGAPLDPSWLALRPLARRAPAQNIG
jgi:RNA polymerase-binding transcription factor DksA